MPKGAKKNDDTFYIVDEELALLNPAVKAALKGRLQKETLTAYETPQEIDKRMKAVDYSKLPALQAKIDGYAAQIKAGKLPDMSFEDFPAEAMGAFLYGIGASGISFYMLIFLRDPSFAENKELIETVASLSRARHNILQRNSAVHA